MENKIVTKSLRRQLDQIILHEQVENGISISNDLNVNQVDQWFETPKVGNHGHIEIQDMYHERVKILNRLREKTKWK
jgi:hypothetical protein